MTEAEVSTWINPALTFAGMVGNAVVLAVVGTWRLGLVRDELKTQAFKDKEELKTQIIKNRDDLQQTIRVSESDMEQKQFRSEELTGEAMRAMREYCNQLALSIKDAIIEQSKLGMWVRDNFVGNKDLESLGHEVRRLGERVDHLSDNLRSDRAAPQ